MIDLSLSLSLCGPCLSEPSQASPGSSKILDQVGWRFSLQALAFPATVDGTAAAAVALWSAYVAAASLTGREAEASLAGVPFAFFCCFAVVDDVLVL